MATEISRPRKTPVAIFIHGRKHSSLTWSLSTTGKNIDIVETIGKKYDTLTVDIDFEAGEDVGCHVNTVQVKLREKGWSHRRLVLVSHSLGVAIVLGMLRESFDVAGLVLIEPTPLGKNYLEEISLRGWRNMSISLQEFDQIRPAPRICVHVHVDFRTDHGLLNATDSFESQVDFYSKFTTPNVLSKFIVHPGKGHMLHHTDAQKISASISEVLASGKK